MTIDRRRLLSGIAAAGATAAVGFPAGCRAQTLDVKTDMTIRAPGLFPEGFAYSWSTHAFYVGSVARGRITTVADGGGFSTFSDDPALVSTFGIFLDGARNVVYACNGDDGRGRGTSAATQGKLCEILAFDIENGKRLQTIDLGALAPNVPHLPADGTAAPDGTLYVTDALAPVVYRVAPDGTPSVLVSDLRLAAAADGRGLHGIALAQSGVLIVDIIASGLLYRIDPQKTTVSAITLGLQAPSLVGCAGMRFDRDGRLWIAQGVLGGEGAKNMVHVLRSDDDWQTATVERSFAMRASTSQVAFTPAGPYAIAGRLEELVTRRPEPTVDGFSIVAIEPSGG